MNWTLLAYNILLQALVFWTIIVLIKLTQQYRLPFLKEFLAFAIGFSLFGFVIFFLQDVMLPLALSETARMDLILRIMMVFLLMPITLGTIFFLVRAVFRLVGEPVPGWVKWTYWLMGLLLMAATALAMEYFLRTDIYDYVGAVYAWGFMIFNQLVIFLSLFYGQARARGMDDGNLRRLALGWIRLLGALFFIYYIMLMGFSDIPWVYNSLGIWFYLVIILPVVYLRRVLPRDFNVYRRTRSAVGDVGRRAADLGLSPREREIVALVLAGRSNSDIEAELYISQRTVKNHLYNIYRRLKIKNRVELFRLFLDS